MQNPALSKGFTLVEILLVVSIIAILSGFLIPGFSGYLSTQNIKQAQELFKSDLRSIQNKALTGVGSTTANDYWGVKITDNNASNYYFFSSVENTEAECSAVNTATSEISDTLPGEVVIRNAAGSCVFFSLDNGDATVTGNGGSSIFGLAYENEVPCYGVEINSVGMVRTKDITCE